MVDYENNKTKWFRITLGGGFGGDFAAGFRLCD
jgi:hypothetical protein